jgi:two-component system, cell cycle response regulator
MNNHDTHKRILVAEDDPLSRRLLECLLAKWGYNAMVVPDGMSALAILEGPNAPRLAILDWMMPRMEGIRICQRVRERKGCPYTYILLLTARSLREDLLQALEVGADDYLTKPFDGEELRARLRAGDRILSLQDDLLVARDEMYFRATNDALTGISNRSAVLEALDKELARQSRDNRSFGIILADIDHFKHVNDNYGHLSGDDVLRAVAQGFLASTRPYDSVGRYGGEEFLIVAPFTDVQTTMALAERIRRNLESQPVIARGSSIGVTASFGIAVSTCPPCGDAKILLQLADDALYRAKAKGRNRSETAEASGRLSVC